MLDRQLFSVFTAMPVNLLAQGESSADLRAPSDVVRMPAQMILLETRRAVAALAWPNLAGLAALLAQRGPSGRASSRMCQPGLRGAAVPGSPWHARSRKSSEASVPSGPGAN